MKKSWLIISGIVLVIGSAMVFLLLTNRNDSPQDASQAQDLPAQAATPETSEPAGQRPTAQPGAYTAYNAEVLAKTAGRKVLFFHAPWCPQCRQLEKSIQQGGIPEGVTIFKTDYDTSTALRQKYGVALQTTLVEIDASGNLVGKYVAYDDPTLGAVITGLKL